MGKGSEYLEDPLPVVLKWSIDRVWAEQVTIAAIRLWWADRIGRTWKKC